MVLPSGFWICYLKINTTRWDDPLIRPVNTTRLVIGFGLKILIRCRPLVTWMCEMSPISFTSMYNWHLRIFTLRYFSWAVIWVGCCKLETEILKEAKQFEKWPKMIILRHKNVILERFWPLLKFHFLACSTLDMSHIIWLISSNLWDEYLDYTI